MNFDYDYDIVIIGAGSAGLSAYDSARQYSGKVALVERGPYGTTCARVGCMPSKLLISAANAVKSINEAESFGIQVGTPVIDGRKVLERVRTERDRFVDLVKKSMKENISEDGNIMGEARFVDHNNLEISDYGNLSFNTAVIAAGSRPKIPEELKKIKKRLVTYEDIFYWDELPKSVAVVGTGAIGLEIGQALHRLGVRTVVMGHGSIASMIKDKEVNSKSIEIFKSEFPVIADAKLKILREKDDYIETLYFNEVGEGINEKFDYIISAAGVTSNIETLDLESLNLELNESGIPKYNPFTMQCGNSNIFIAGDICGEKTILHEANHEGKVAGLNAARFPEIESVPGKAPFRIVFTDPQIFSVGEDLDALMEKYSLVEGGKEMKDQGRSRVMNRDKGLLKVYAENGSGYFLGAQMIGPDAEHLGHLLAWALQQKLTVDEILDLPFYHPVVEESIETAFMDLKEKLSENN